MASIQCLNRTLLFNHLRSIVFDFPYEAIENSARVHLIQQVLDASPNLSELEVPWKDFLHCSQTYSRLKYVYLLLYRIHATSDEPVHIDRLVQLVPNVCHLEIGNASIMFNENVIEFVLNIIHRFQQLVHFKLNKDCPYRSKYQKKVIFKELLTKAIHERFFDRGNIQIELCVTDELFIWL